MTPPRNPISILRALRSITLPTAHKERMRADLSAYADLHTLTEARAPLSKRTPFAFMLPARSLYAGALTLVLMVAGTTQASLVSEHAMPGDVLYPIKVAVSEPLSFMFSSSGIGKAELAARFASRRVDEAAALSSVGKLDEKTADQLATRFDTHVDVVAKETDTLEAKGEISTSLAVRTDLEQKISERVEEFASKEMAVASTIASLGSDDVAERFSARVSEKSKTLATTRERLEGALALDVKAGIESGASLATLRTPEPADARLLFATSVMDDAATSTATTTATSTEMKEDAAPEPTGARFFMPFLRR